MRASADVARACSGNLAVALDLIEQSIPVFPVAAGGPTAKAPLTPHGFHDATIDPDQVQAWHRQHPQAVWAYPTSSATTVVLDVDGAQGLASLAALCHRLGIEDERALSPVRVRTPRGGQHIHFRLREGEVFRNRAGDIAPAIDTRGVRENGLPAGYIIAPGNRLANGRGYEHIGESHDLADAAFVQRPLLVIACFSPREHDRIKRTPTLRAALQNAYPSDWTAIYAEHAAREHAEILRRAKPACDDAMSRQAAHDLQEAGRELAALTDGRRNALYRIGCRVSKYVAHGLLAEAQFVAVLASAADANGSVARHGRAWVSGVLTRALAAGRNDPLPPVARHFRQGRLAA